MNYCLDTNLVVAMFFEDEHSARVDRWLTQAPRRLALSRWAETEFVAIVGRRTRAREISRSAAVAVLADFDAWALESTERLETTVASGQLAAALARDERLKLTAADALHLALSVSHGLVLATLDRRLEEAARMRGDAVAEMG